VDRDEILSLDDRALLDQCTIDTYRASGPGGQKRNKTSSAIRLRHGPTKLLAVAVESRSQHENRARALKRLRKTIALRVRQTVDIEAYHPGDVLASCISGASRLCVGRKDQRFAHVLAEVLDVLLACGGRVSLAAEKIGVGTANLVTLIQSDPKLLAAVNEMRRDLGVKPLR
jgi:RF-1 domain